MTEEKKDKTCPLCGAKQEYWHFPVQWTAAQYDPEQHWKDIGDQIEDWKQSYHLLRARYSRRKGLLRTIATTLQEVVDSIAPDNRKEE